MDKKVSRILNLYSRAAQGEVLIKAKEARRFGVNERSIQRDIDDIRAYLAENPQDGRVLFYDRKRGGYVLENPERRMLTNSEVLTVCKILLESRSLMRGEMMPIIDKLLQCCVPYGDFKKVSELIGNEKFHYLEPHHGKRFVNAMWDIGSAVYEHRLMRIAYHKLKQQDQVMRMVQPVGIMFSEYYFYLCAFMCASEETPNVTKRPFPTIYRIDRIERYEVLEEHFYVPYRDRFEEGEFRKRIQFMFGGQLRTLRFRYKGLSVESVLDRLPTAEIEAHDERGWLIHAEVYGDGIDMWLRSQGDMIEMVE